MSIAIKNYKLTQPTTPLKVGDNDLSIDFIGVVDTEAENEVSVKGTIDDDAPIVFKKTGTKIITFKMKFPVGKEGPCNTTITVTLAKNATPSLPAQIKMEHVTPQGKRRTTFPIVIY